MLNVTALGCCGSNLRQSGLRTEKGSFVVPSDRTALFLDLVSKA